MHNRKPKKENTETTKKPMLSKSQLDRITEKTKLESDYEDMVCKALRAVGADPLKFFSSWSTGWPDRIVLTKSGRTLWIEFKKPGGRYARLQELNRSWLIRNDHAYYMLDTYERCMWFINKVIPIIK